MGEPLSSEQLRDGLARMARALMGHAGELNALDAVMGDGDLGVTMRLGCQAVLDDLAGLAGADVATICTRTGMAFNRAAASTMGALIATAGMRAGREAKGADAIDLALLARMVAAAEAGMRERGKAQRGEKTLLDALIPAAEALERAAAEDAGFKAAALQALQAARAGRDATIAMRATIGRARWAGERTVGQPDAGASALVIALEALAPPR
jgi:dihydroxyacetone kinase